jgi:hypothetical protein
MWLRQTTDSCVGLVLMDSAAMERLALTSTIVLCCRKSTAALYAEVMAYAQTLASTHTSAHATWAIFLPQERAKRSGLATLKTPMTAMQMLCATTKVLGATAVHAMPATLAQESNALTRMAAQMIHVSLA